MVRCCLPFVLWKCEHLKNLLEISFVARRESPNKEHDLIERKQSTFTGEKKFQ